MYQYSHIQLVESNLKLLKIFLNQINTRQLVKKARRITNNARRLL